jgi:hypothetical protein
VALCKDPCSDTPPQQPLRPVPNYTAVPYLEECAPLSASTSGYEKVAKALSATSFGRVKAVDSSKLLLTGAPTVFPGGTFLIGEVGLGTSFTSLLTSHSGHRSASCGKRAHPQSSADTHFANFWGWNDIGVRTDFFPFIACPSMRQTVKRAVYCVWY